MYVCICKAVTERQIREAVDDGVRSMRELYHYYGVATSCGKCAKLTREVLNNAVASALDDASDAEYPAQLALTMP